MVQVLNTKPHPSREVPSMHRRILCLCSLIAIAVVHQRCSSALDKASVTPTPATDSNTTQYASRQASIHGNAMLGAVVGAHVTVYAMDPNTGILDANMALGAVVTDSSGEYNVVVDANTLDGHPFALQMRGGSYVEEASGATVVLGDTTYTTLLPPLATDGNVVAALGPLPDMAYQLFQRQVAAGGAQDSNLATLIANASYQVSQAFGIPDVVGTLPADPNSSIPNDASGQYTLILAAISHAAAQAGVNSTAMAAAFSTTFAADGNFTGLGNGNVTVRDPNGRPISLAPPSFATLQNTVTSIGNGNIVLPRVQPPPSFAPPTLQPRPPDTAPVGYVPGAPPVIDPNTPVTPMPLPTVIPTGRPDPNTVSNPNVVTHPPGPTPTPTPTPISIPIPTPTPSPDTCTTQTYTNYGRGFFANNCLTCHSQGGDGFSSIDLTTFASISANRTRISGQIEAGLMPRNATLPTDVRNGILAWLSCTDLLR